MGLETGKKRISNSSQISITMDWLIQVALGKVLGVSLKSVVGKNINITAGEDYWEYGNAYTYTDNAGATYYFSGAAGDAGALLEIDLIVVTAAGLWVRETLALTHPGAAKTALVPTLGTPVRIEEIRVTGGTALANDIYFYEDSTVSSGTPTDLTKIRGWIRTANQKTLMGMYTCPSNTFALILEMRLDMSDGGVTQPGELRVSLNKKLYGGVFLDIDHFLLYNGSSQKEAGLDLGIIPAKTDLKFNVESYTGDGGVYGNVRMSILEFDSTIYTTGS